jgi:predicted lipoprotein
MRPMKRSMWAPLCAVALATCDGSGAPDAGPDTLAERKREVLAHVGEVIVLRALNDFVDAAALLETASESYAAGRSAESLASAQQAWTDAIAIWEQLEVVMLGPGGAATFTGGLAIRDEIYSFPLTNTCRIDQETVGGAYADPDAFAAAPVNVRGLGAIEYLLFVATTENTCTSVSPINADGTWAALGDDAVAQRRAEYARSLAILVSRSAVRLRDAWDASGGDFLGSLATAGDGSPLFATSQDAMNELAGALLYIDTIAKEMKVGEPSGIIRCTAGPMCLAELESRLSARSKEHILINLRAFQRVFLGDEPGTAAPGFDDMLADVGQAALSAQLEAAIADTIAAVEALPGTLEEAITNEPALVMAAYETFGAMLRLFKMDVFGALDIEVTVVPTDND